MQILSTLSTPSEVLPVNEDLNIDIDILDPIAETGLNLSLRSYQRQGIAEIDKHIENGVKRILRQNYTGTGKSVEQLFLAARHIKQNKNNIVLFLVPTEELIENLAKYLLDNGIRVSYIKSGRTTLYNSQVYIASVATLIKRLDKLPVTPTLIMADECFPKGTLVDGKPIEQYKVGDFVWSWDENTGILAKKKITKVFINPIAGIAPKLINITCQAKFKDVNLQVTNNHPFYVKNKGWVNAENLKQGDIVFKIIYPGTMFNEPVLTEAKILYVEEKYCDQQNVYNLEIEDYHTYFVESILVHNCHHSPAASWSKCLNNWDCVKVGFSATPERLDGKPFTDLFDELVEGKPYSWYIEHGYLAPFRIAPIKALSANFKKRGGEYDLHQQQEFYNNPKIVGDAVLEWAKYCLGEKTIVFASGLEHSRELVNRYNDFGMNQYGKQIAEHLDGSSDSNYRKNKEALPLVLDGKKYESFRKYTMDRFKLPLDHPQSLLILSNFQLFVEGVDIPDCNVTQWLRLTASEIIWDQGNGRSGRFRPNKVQTILDHVGNLGLHGLPDRTRTWSLEGRKAREKTSQYHFICKGCNKLLATDYRVLMKQRDDEKDVNKKIEWLECPSCDAANMIPIAQKRGERKVKEVDLDGELEFLDLTEARAVNLIARFRKFQNLSERKFFEKLLQYADMSLDDFKAACNFKNLPESYAYSTWSKKMQNLM